MKPQDIVFILFMVLFLVFLRKPKLFVISGLTCFVLSIPLFITQTFFTAQRLTMYGAAFILIACLLLLFTKKSRK